MIDDYTFLNNVLKGFKRKRVKSPDITGQPLLTTGKYILNLNVIFIRNVVLI